MRQATIDYRVLPVDILSVQKENIDHILSYMFDFIDVK